MSERAALKNFLTTTIEAHDFLQRFAKKPYRDEVLSFLPTAAAYSYLFAATQVQQLAAVAIVGPTNKPNGIHCYHQGGKILFCYYALVHPQWRVLGRGLELLRSMLMMARIQYPDCESLFYWRHDGKTPKEYLIGDIPWAAREPSLSGMVASVRSPNSSGSTKVPSGDSRSPPSSTSS